MGWAARTTTRAAADVEWRAVRRGWAFAGGPRRLGRTSHSSSLVLPASAWQRRRLAPSSPKRIGRTWGGHVFAAPPPRRRATRGLPLTPGGGGASSCLGPPDDRRRARPSGEKRSPPPLPRGGRQERLLPDRPAGGAGWPLARGRFVGTPNRRKLRNTPPSSFFVGSPAPASLCRDRWRVAARKGLGGNKSTAPFRFALGSTSDGVVAFRVPACPSVTARTSRPATAAPVLLE